MFAAKRMAAPVLDLYVAWYCPFAQRAHIAAEDLEVPYTMVESDPYDKTDANPLKKVNPRVLVPAILHNGRNIYESNVCVEYLDEEFGGKYNNRRLMPHDNYERAQLRICLETMGSKAVPPFYKALSTSRTAPEAAEAKEKFLEGIQEMDRWMGEFQDRKAQAGGDVSPYFTGGEFSMLDVSLAPFFAVRMNVLEHYTGIKVPETAEYARFNKWVAAVLARESVVKTSPDPEKLIDFYTKYAKK